MNIAHGVITAHMGQMYRSSYYSGGQWKCDEATMTNDKIYNKIDVRKDGYLFTSNGAPSHALTGTNGQISKIWMSGDEAGAFYVQTYKKDPGQHQQRVYRCAAGMERRKLPEGLGY
jgi:hypothetical protein